MNKFCAFKRAQLPFLQCFETLCSQPESSLDIQETKYGNVQWWGSEWEMFMQKEKLMWLEEFWFLHFLTYLKNPTQQSIVIIFIWESFTHTHIAVCLGYWERKQDKITEYCLSLVRVKEH